ncbi:MAG: MMPL family transporter [Bacteroidetes bacterium]|nr:MMPL family transporter [Bacteroidota bacterium]
MIPKQGNEKDYSSIITNNKQLEKIIVSVSIHDSVTNPNALISFTESLSQQIQELDSTKLIESIETKQDESQLANMLSAVQNNLPFLLKEKDYQQLDSLLIPLHLSQLLKNNYRILASPGGLAMKQMIANDPLGLGFIPLKRLQDLQQDENSSLYDGYIVSNDERYLSFIIKGTYPASNTKMNEGLANLLQESIRSCKQKQPEFKNIACHAFGAQLVAAGNAIQMRSDTKLTLGITVILLCLLFIFFFRNKLSPIQIMIPVIFGALFGMAMMFLLKGSVSMLALGASSVILGIAVNYSLHFLSHYRHSQNKAITIAELSTPMTIGSFTTIAAFLGLTFMRTPVLNELGLFTALNLAGSSLCTLVFLPHFIGKPKAQDKLNVNWLDKISLFHPEKNKWIVIGICIITISLAFFAGDVRFNEDMMKMNFMSEELQSAQKVINQQNAESLNSIFCVSEGKTKEEALEKSVQSEKQLLALKQKGLLRKFSNPADFILSDKQQQIKLDTWNNFWTEEKKLKLLQNVNTIGSEIGFSNSAFNNLKTILNTKYQQPDSFYINAFHPLFNDFIVEDKKGFAVIQLIKTEQKQRANLFQSFQEDQSSYLTDKQLITTKFVACIKDDFYKILFLTSFIVFFTILISYGRIEIALISFLPMVITWVCILGLMGLFGIEFNIINIIISTLIFGLGDDYSIFITDGLLEKYSYGKQKITSIKTSVYLSAITTIIGLGILIFAKHPALKSIAAVSVIGIASIILVSQTLQPLLFNFFIQNRANKRLFPFTFWSFIKTIFAFTYYFLGCILVTIIGFILTKCIPFAKPKMKYIFHVVICKMMWSLLYTMANVKKTFANKHEADFSKPAVIIANHASFLDLLRIISLHPKILLLTNQWVWRSPVFGALVRMADYYPVEEGAEFSIEKLADWTRQGYSIAVFPEGTRSFDDKIKRFHKGAFYIAEKLQLDVLPILFHGVGHSMRKGDFLCKDGEINLKFLPRIKPQQTEYGNTYAERAKLIGKYFRTEFEKFTQQKETTHYFREQLIKNYIYKGPVLEWYCRIKSKLERNYEPIEKLVPAKGNILDIGCGYGFLDYMLLWTSSERNIKGIDYDENKIEIARHNFLKEDRITFEVADAIELNEMGTFDCIILLDVLHYLQPEHQNQLLEKIYNLLNHGGIFILRDGITEMKEKIKGTMLSEFFSTKLFHFNKTNNALHYISLSSLEKFANEHTMEMTMIDDTKFTSNVTFVLKKTSVQA